LPAAKVAEPFGAFGLKAFKELFRGAAGAEYAMVAAVVAAFVMIAANTGLRSTSISRESLCCGPDRFEDYRGPRA
jgi:Flp pilus assembly pilin Flp